MLSARLISIQPINGQSPESTDIEASASAFAANEGEKTMFNELLKQFNVEPSELNNETDFSVLVEKLSEQIGEMLPLDGEDSDLAEDVAPEAFSGEALLAYLMANAGIPVSNKPVSPDSEVLTEEDAASLFFKSNAVGDSEAVLLGEVPDEAALTFSLPAQDDEVSTELGEVAQIALDEAPSDALDLPETGLDEHDLAQGDTEALSVDNLAIAAQASFLDVESEGDAEMDNNDELGFEADVESAINSDHSVDVQTSASPVQSTQAVGMAENGVGKNLLDNAAKINDESSVLTLKPATGLPDAEPKPISLLVANGDDVSPSANKSTSLTSMVATSETKTDGEINADTLAKAERDLTLDDGTIDDTAEFDKSALSSGHLTHRAVTSLTTDQIQSTPGEIVEKSVKLSQAAHALADKISTMVSGNIKHAIIRLDPPELGALEVRLQVHHDQTQVQIISHSSQVRDALESQSVRLRETLADQGLNLSNLDISHRESNDQSGQESQSQGRNATGFAEGDEAEQADAVVKVSSVNGLVDHYV